jgi:cysteinyl-tRNA synthetase
MKTGLQIYNTLSGNMEEFQPIQPPKVGMYVCGPTVYNEVHIGNVRTFINFDLIYRYLTFLGYKVRYVRNITDVGHLLGDAVDGEDRISKQSRLEAIEPMELVQKYTNNFHDVLQKFNLLPPSIEPTATAHILEQIEWTQALIDAGFAYISNGSVYFDVLKYLEKFPYGELSGRKIEDLKEVTRELDGVSDKKNQQDFALWKKAEPEHLMQWNSPWGKGFPGWHLECSVMSTKYLGEQFDIHGGGMDLKFPHHECEIAQNKGLHHHDPVKYWMHANMLTLNGRKMSKSDGNFFTPLQLIEGTSPHFSKPYSAEVLRFFVLQAHYRSTLDITETALNAAEVGFKRLMDGVKSIAHLKTSAESNFNLNHLIEGCFNSMNEDFNAPKLIAQLFEIINHVHKIHRGDLSISVEDKKLLENSMNAWIYDVLGLFESNQQNQELIDGLMEMILQQRKKAKELKDWETSDQIRINLEELGISIKDSKDGTTYSIS